MRPARRPPPRNQAVLTLGARIDEPAVFVGRLNDLLMALTEGADSAANTTDG